MLENSSKKIENSLSTPSKKKITEVLTKGVEEVIERKSLIKKLRSGKRLRIKYGADPSAPDLHLGHSVCLLKLKEFQDLGHQIIFVIGDFTAKIGDPSKRMAARPPLSLDQIKKNTQTYLSQLGKILNLRKTKIIKNSQWFSKMSLEDLLKLAGKFTIARLLEREDFARRLKKGIEVGLHEIIYPLLQAFDSLKLKADIEVGGSDQKLNLLAARELQRRTGQSSQDLVIVPLLIGIDGSKKMSKSLGNYIGITEQPKDQYGKIMSIPDHLIRQYFELTTRIPLKELERMFKDLKQGKITARNLKARLARQIVTLYHGPKPALKAEQEFEKVFKQKKLPSKISKISISDKTLNILDLLVKIKLSPSRSEAKRLVQQGGVKIDDEVQIDWKKVIKIKKGQIIQVGKRKFVKIV